MPNEFVPAVAVKLKSIGFAVTVAASAGLFNETEAAEPTKNWFVAEVFKSTLSFASAFQ